MNVIVFQIQSNIVPMSRKSPRKTWNVKWCIN